MEFFHTQRDIEKTRHKLPHWQQGRVPVFVTFRLADSLPQAVIEPLMAAREAFLKTNPFPWDEVTEDRFHRQFSVKMEQQLDVSHGGCALRDSRLATIVAERLLHFHAQRYDLQAYVIMPNHVHALFTPYGLSDLPGTVQAWKGVSSRMIHQAGLSMMNPF